MKRLAVFLLAVFFLLSAAGCDGGNQSSDASDSGTSSVSTEVADSSEEGTEAEPITIQFWNGWTGADGEILTKYVEEFNSSNPYGITIEMDINPEFLTKIAAAFAGDQGPDFVLAPSVFKYQYTDYLIDLNEIFDATELQKDDFISSYMDSCTTNDALYVLPFQVTGRYMYWNKDLFEKAGLDPEKGPESYEQWQEYAALITDPSANVYGSGLSYNSPMTNLQFLQRMGGLFVDYNDAGELTPRFKDNEGYAKFLSWFKAMLDSGDNPMETDTDSMMRAGQIGITASGPWLNAGLKESGINYGVSMMPYDEAGKQNPCSISGFAVTKFASDEAKEAAFRFIEWWFNGYENTETTGILAWSLECGYPGFYTPAIEDERYATSDVLTAMTPTDSDVITTYMAPEEYYDTFTLANEVVEVMIESVVVNNEDITTALNTAQDNAEAALEKFLSQ